jgi:poly(3-hydroxybutyrate) depolymerase
MAPLRVPPIEYTAAAIAINDGRLDDAAVAMLAIGADKIAEREGLPLVAAPTEKEARWPAREHQRP